MIEFNAFVFTILDYSVGHRFARFFCLVFWYLIYGRIQVVAILQWLAGIAFIFGKAADTNKRMWSVFILATRNVFNLNIHYVFLELSV